MATAAPSQIAVPSSWIADEILERTGLAIERVVMLVELDGQPAVRKLTPAEKLAYADRTDESVLVGSDEEQEELFALLAEQAEADQRR